MGKPTNRSSFGFTNTIIEVPAKLRFAIGPITLIFFVAIVLSGCVQTISNLHVTQGVISLTAWQADDFHPINLRGPWNIRPIVQDSPGVISLGTLDENTSQYLSLPGGIPPDAILSTNQIGLRYQIQIIDLPEAPPLSVLAFLIGKVHGAYTISINETLVYRAEEFTETPREKIGVPKVAQHTQSITISQGSTLIEFPYPEDGDVTLSIDVIGPQNLRGGIAGPLIFGFTSDVTRDALRKMSLDILNISGLFVLGLFLVGFFLVRPIEESAVFLGLFALLSALNHGISGHQGLSHILGAVQYDFLNRVATISLVLAAPLLFEYTRREIVRKSLKKPRQLLWWLTGIFILMVFILPASAVWTIMPPFLMITFAYSVVIVQLLVPRIRSRESGSLIFFLCFLLLQIAGFAFIFQWISGVDAGGLPSGLTLVSVFLQTIYLGRQFSSGFSEAEGLNHRLKQLLRQQDKVQENLERTVISRTSDLRAALDAAKSASTAKGNFLANMSHEIRTPLNGILGFCELLQYEPGGHEAPNYIRLIRSESLRLLEIINQLLDISKIEAGKLELEINPFDIHEMLQVTASNMRIQARNKGLFFTVVVDENLPRYLSGDSLRLRQILDNLLTNATKFTDEGSITLEIHHMEEPDGRILLKITVEDTGIGIPPERQRRIFDAFEQADPSTTRLYGGTGLGTAIALKLARMMDGDIKLQSTQGRGSRFEVEVRLGKIQHNASLPLNEPSPQTEPRWKNSPHVLLVEDYELNRVLTRKHLESAGWQVSGVENGQEAIDFFAKTQVDCIIMDIQMPILDGYRATSILREQGFNKPIIGLSANVFPEDQERALKMGMNTILSKPLNRHTLLHYMAKYIPPGSYIQAGARAGNPDNILIPRDTPPILKDLDGDLASYLSLIKDFLSSAQELLKEMDSAAAQGELEVLHRGAHTIKGGALNIGASLVAETALQIEIKTKTGMQKGWQESLSTLRHQLEEISNTLG